MTSQEIVLLVYNLALVPVAFLSILFLFLSILNLIIDRSQEIASISPTRSSKKLPFVTVQICSYNDRVALRCIEKCLAFDYPKNRYEIMILDDSTDKKTSALLAAKAQMHSNVSFVHRNNRDGYKPGALKSAMPLVKGSIIVLFDSDFVPESDFLRKILVPFDDPKVAIVQAGQGIMNTSKNLISRFAAYLLITYHTIMMPINNKFNTVLFCGTAGAIRKSVIIKAGGWNTKSVTEDADLSVRILSLGYKSVYLKFDTPSEVPVTFEAFLKQQMRWCFGGVRVFFDYTSTILFKRGLNGIQRIIISFLTLGNLAAPAVIIMTLAGLVSWFLGDIKLFGMSELLEFIIKFFYTSGFFVMGYITLYKRRNIKEFPQLVLAALSISIVLAFANSIAIYKAIFFKDKPLFTAKKNSWICTPKAGNALYK